MLKRHLQIGVGKSAITQEQADAKLAEWVKTKTDKIQTRIEGLSKAKHSAAKARKDAETKVKEARTEAIRKKAIVPVAAPSEPSAEVATEGEAPAETQA
jgi:small subunit ribosomal protein S16